MGLLNQIIIVWKLLPTTTNWLNQNQLTGYRSSPGYNPVGHFPALAAGVRHRGCRLEEEDVVAAVRDVAEDTDAAAADDEHIAAAAYKPSPCVGTS